MHIDEKQALDLMTYFTQIADTQVRVVYNFKTKEIMYITAIEDGRPIHIASQERDQLTKMLP